MPLRRHIPHYKDNLQKSGNDSRMMATTNITGPQTKTFERLICSPVWEVDLKQHSISFSVVNILLSITATLANSLILVALHKESSLHPPSKLLYRCLATSDLLVGVVNHPLYAAYWMSLAHEHWSLGEMTVVWREGKIRHFVIKRVRENMKSYL